MAWCHTWTDIDNPKSAWSPDWFKNHVVYSRGKITVEKFQSKPGQVFGIYFETKKRIAHMGMITGEDRLHYRTIEGNTDASGGREGDGVYRRVRKKDLVYKIVDYVPKGQ